MFFFRCHIRQTWNTSLCQWQSIFQEFQLYLKWWIKGENKSTEYHLFAFDVKLTFLIIEILNTHPEPMPTGGSAAAVNESNTVSCM